jgi:hypothetical protein
VIVRGHKKRKEKIRRGKDGSNVRFKQFFLLEGVKGVLAWQVVWMNEYLSTGHRGCIVVRPRRWKDIHPRGFAQSRLGGAFSFNFISLIIQSALSCLPCSNTFCTGICNIHTVLHSTVYLLHKYRSIVFDAPIKILHAWKRKKGEENDGV